MPESDSAHQGVAEAHLPATGTWSVPQLPITVEYSCRVLEEIRLQVMEAFYSVPRGGAEIGGILLGRHENGRVVVAAQAGLDCEHATGPSFTLSPNDHRRFSAMVAAANRNPGGLSPVGWYHSHTRSEIFLSEADRSIHELYFPEPWQVALVLKPHTFQPMRAAFFVKDGAGRLRCESPYAEFTVEVPGGQRPTPGSERSTPAAMPAAPPAPRIEPGRAAASERAPEPPAPISAAPKPAESIPAMAALLKPVAEPAAPAPAAKPASERTPAPVTKPPAAPVPYQPPAVQLAPATIVAPAPISKPASDPAANPRVVPERVPLPGAAKPVRVAVPAQAPAFRLEPEPMAAPVVSPKVTPEPVAPPAAAPKIALEPPAVPDSESLDLPTPSFAQVAPERSWGWVIPLLAIAAGVGLGVVAYQTRALWMRTSVSWVHPVKSRIAPKPVSGAVGLRTVDTEGQLWIVWDRNSPVVRYARRGTLLIHDDGQSHVIGLDSGNLQTGSFTYARQSERVDVTLTLEEPNSDKEHEAASFFGPLPVRSATPAPAPAAPASDAAKLKTDLAAERARSRKLEQSLNDALTQLKQARQLQRLEKQDR